MFLLFCVLSLGIVLAVPPPSPCLMPCRILVAPLIAFGCVNLTRMKNNIQNSLSSMFVVGMGYKRYSLRTAEGL